MKKSLRLKIFVCTALCAGLFTCFNFVTAVNGRNIQDTKFTNVKVNTNKPYESPKLWNGEKVKIAYLTFDDGPSKYTEQIVDILTENKVGATFFPVGTNVERWPEKIDYIKEHGHYVGLHSMTHDYETLYGDASGKRYIKEMTTLRSNVQSIIGEQGNLIRSPYGSVPGIKQPFVDKIKQNDFKLWDWTIDSNDWRHKNKPNQIVKDITSQLTQDVEVILVHEREQTVRVLPKIIKELKAKGYTLLAYDESMHFPVNFLNRNDI
ncbi:MAG: polysaccharide deacetylase family protein [Bacilli bacterium]